MADSPTGTASAGTAPAKNDSAENTKAQIAQSLLLSRLTAGVLAVLLVIFFLTTIGNTATILNKVETVKIDQYPASVAAGHLETRLVQLRTIASRAIYMNTPGSADDLISINDDASAEIWEMIGTLDSCASVNQGDMDTLQNGYAELNKRLNVLADMVRDAVLDADTNSSAVGEYVDDNVYPLISELLKVDSDVLDESTAAVDSVYLDVNKACRQTIFASWILILAVAISLCVYLALLRRKTHREEELTADLRRALDVANRASQAKSTFLSSMSHDIRTPMNAIVGLTTIALSNMDDPERVKSCLERITISSKHLLSLVNDVLDMSEIENGRIALNEDVIDLPTMLNDVASIMETQARNKKLELQMDVGPLEHTLVHGDALRLQQAILNLAGNAVKYTEAGGWVRLSLKEEGPAAAACNSEADIADARSAATDDDVEDVSNDAEEIRVYKLIVEDNGIGMDPTFLNDIFKPFEREHNQVTPSTEGAGLGMAITKRVVDLMGGTIKVESKLGEGSKFTVTLPLKIMEAPEKSADAPETGATAPISGRVLLVEDDALNREIAIELIGSLGVETDIACDGVEAVEAFSREPYGHYGMIFMDFQMPRMGGVEAARNIIEMEKAEGRPHTPIVAMTANAFNEDRQKAIDAGMDGFMSKPISMEQLNRNLHKFLKGQIDGTDQEEIEEDKETNE